MNLLLPVRMNPYCVVDLTNVYPSNVSVTWEIWNTCMMGLKTSPYLTTQSMVCTEEFIRGYAGDSDKRFQWLNIRLNLPGDPKYSPILSWVLNLTKD